MTSRTRRTGRLKEWLLVVLPAALLLGVSLAIRTPAPLYAGLAGAWLFGGWAFGQFVATGGVAPGWDMADEEVDAAMRRGGWIGLGVAAAVLLVLAVLAVR